MSTMELEPSLQPGQPAPDLTLPAVEREGTVSLSDYRGKSALLLGLFRGLYCPMCHELGARSQLRFLIDRDGIVRWIDIECGRDGLAGIGKFSGEEALQAAVRAL